LLEGKNQNMNVFKKVWSFYRDGFKNMNKTSKKLWVIILIKLFIMFAVLRLFFFPDVMETQFSDDKERSDHIIKELTNP
jgi:hypothetical protein